MPGVGCVNAMVGDIGVAGMPMFVDWSAIGAMVRAFTSVRFAVARPERWMAAVWVGEVLASPATVMATRMPTT